MDENISSGAGESGAVSVFGNANANDFPVLKAFQEYIDAEQAKARKRMLGLSVFFIVLLSLVVATFTVIVTIFVNRNQALSDRLLDIALREKSAPQPVVTVQQPAPVQVAPPPQQPADSALKPLLDKLESLATALAARPQQPVAPAPVVVTTAGAPVQQPSADNAELARIREELKKQQDELKAERARAEEARKKLREAEIEQHRRRLYPDYYARMDAQRAAALPPPQPAGTPAPASAARPTSAAAQPPPSSLSALAPVSYFAQTDDDELANLVKRSAPPAKPAAQPAPAKPAAQPAPAKPAPEKPAPAKPAPPPVRTETLSIGGGDDALPWLIETP